MQLHCGEALYEDSMEGVNLEFADWRFNLRMSNTELPPCLTVAVGLIQVVGCIHSGLLICPLNLWQHTCEHCEDVQAGDCSCYSVRRQRYAPVAAFARDLSQAVCGAWGMEERCSKIQCLGLSAR